MRIVFAGTPDFSVPALTALVESDYQVVAVYTQPDRPAGRGRKLTPSPVKQVAERSGIPVYQPDSMRKPDAIQQLRELKPDLMVVVAYGLILPTEVLDIPSIDCINIHASLLPRWRGAAPIHRAIISGDQETGVTIMRMEPTLDTGPMLMKQTLLIKRQSSAELFSQLAVLGAEALMAVIPNFEAGAIEFQVQDEKLATYAKKISKQEARLDWHQPTQALDCLIRGLNPWPVANTMLGEKVLRIWRAEPVTDPSQETKGLAPGHILSDGRQFLRVVTADGLLELQELQLPGGKRLQSAEFLNAHQVNGIVLG